LSRLDLCGFCYTQKKVQWRGLSKGLTIFCYLTGIIIPILAVAAHGFGVPNEYPEFFKPADSLILSPVI
jgi:hypothetical protein